MVNKHKGYNFKTKDKDFAPIGTTNDEIVNIIDNKYEGQKRSLESYYKGMNASMVTKVGPTMAHLITDIESTIIDMGTGSGDAASTYENIFSGSKVIGVDINPDSVKYCNDTFAEQGNLKFLEGNIEEVVVPPNSADVILNSSTLHHVSSFNNYSTKPIKRSIENQILQLKDNGIFVIRDFLAPIENSDIIVELSTEKRICTDTQGCSHNYCEFSDAELFEIFSQTARSLEENPGFPIQRIKSESIKGKKYIVGHKYATEFVLRKDYRKDWEVENKEEYTYFNQEEFEDCFEQNGMRILASYPYYNPWIIQNRFKDKFHFYDLKGRTIDYPATNYVIVGQKIPGNSDYGNKIKKTQTDILSSGKDTFLKKKSYRHKGTQEIWDIVERPGKVNDIIPYTINPHTQEVFISVKWGYPRPLMSVNDINIDKKNFSGYICEPHSISTQSSETDIDTRLQTSQYHMEEEIPGLEYFTSPGILSENVKSRFLRYSGLDPHHNLPEYLSGFKNSGEARKMEVNDILRAIQTGTMPEARLEMNLYFLLKQNNKTPQEWIGDTINIQETSLKDKKVIGESELQDKGSLNSFQETSNLGKYITHYRSSFEEVLSIHNTTKSLGKNDLEYVVPSNHSLNIISVLPIIKNSQDGKVYIGIETQEYPSIQEKKGYSDIWGVPAYRLPKNVVDYTGLEQFYQNNISNTPLQKIGESYKPSIGVSPETVYPYTSGIPSDDQNITYIALEDIYNNIEHIKDMHLIISVLRLQHIIQSNKVTNKN